MFLKSDSMMAEELERRTQTERRLREETVAKREAEKEAYRWRNYLRERSYDFEADSQK
jgi:hypothetical protein